MTTLLRRVVCGIAGALMIVALFLPWAQVQDADRIAWGGLWKLTFPLCVGLAGCALTTAITGGQIGLNRPDVSIIGTTDGLGVITTVTLAWLLFYDFPAHASPPQPASSWRWYRRPPQPSPPQTTAPCGGEHLCFHDWSMRDACRPPGDDPQTHISS